MRLTTKGRFAVTAMIDVAMRQHEGPSPWPASASGSRSRCRTWSSCSASCAGGAWSPARAGRAAAIARPTENQTTVADIIFAVDEPIDATQCGGKENCHDDQRCMTHDLWANLNVRMLDYLDSVTLAELVEQQNQRATAGRTSVAVLHDQPSAVTREETSRCQRTGSRVSE